MDRCPGCSGLKVKTSSRCAQCHSRDITARHVDMSVEERAWLAGLIDGGGYISKRTISLVLIDRDTVTKAARLLGAPSVHERAPRKPNHSVTYLAVLGAGASRERFKNECEAYLVARRRRSLGFKGGNGSDVRKFAKLERVDPDSAPSELVVWLAGWLEAEGSCLSGPPPPPNQPSMQITVCDGDAT